MGWEAKIKTLETVENVRQNSYEEINKQYSLVEKIRECDSFSG